MRHETEAGVGRTAFGGGHGSRVMDGDGVLRGSRTEHGLNREDDL
jgi:hypothetical protein